MPSQIFSRIIPSSQSHLYAGGTGGVQGALTDLAGAGVSEVTINIAGGGASVLATAVRACLAVSAYGYYVMSIFLILLEPDLECR